MKRILDIALMISVLTSEKEILDILNGSYVELIIALAALVATIVSVILIATSDKRKKASKLKEKKTEEKKNN
jgi:SNF family Na+-dependent transporter